MAMRALETERMIEVGSRPRIRQVDIFSTQSDMDAFMETFDQAFTMGGEGESWDMWAKRNDVDCRIMADEEYLAIFYLGMSPYMRNPYNRECLIETVYQAGITSHGSEEAYLAFLFFLFSGTVAL